MGCSPSKKKVSRSGTNRLHATILIQRWYRRYRARLDLRRRCTWKIFQSIEYAGEQDQLKLHNFFNNMLVNMSTDGDGQVPLIKAFNVNKRFSIYDTNTMDDEHGESFEHLKDDITVENSYKGPHITFPLTLDQLHKLVQAFKRKHRLHVKYLIELLLEVRKALKTHSNIRYASMALSKQYTVCGDIHGKLSDLYMVFHKNGLPSVDNPYIFNGDFVDRGAFSTEVAIILFACFLMHPNEVFINRGNHEDHVMNVRYGFVKELQLKYPKHSKGIIKLFSDVFSWLPLATVIDDQILVCHGGISDTTCLETIAKIDRHRYLSCLQPPGGCEDITTMSQDDLIEWKQVLDLLWSDPVATDGCSPNTFRGGGSYFGPDVTKAFLQKNNFKLMIRSHECKAEGYEYTHGGQVLTVFSASSYYEVDSNRGAYIRIQGPDHECRILQFQATQSLAQRKVTFTQRVNHVERAALQDLKQSILASRHVLMEKFKKYDHNNTGKISCEDWYAAMSAVMDMDLSWRMMRTVQPFAPFLSAFLYGYLLCNCLGTISCEDWCSAMSSVMEMDLPWRMMRSKLVQVDKAGDAIYETTFEELQVRHRYSGNGPSITETLYRHKETLETIFRLMDTDHSGCISMQEFEDALTILIQQLQINVLQQDIADIARSLDLNNDGYIDFNEFLEAFRIVDNLGKDKTGRLSRNSSHEDVVLPDINEEGDAAVTEKLESQA